MGGETPKKKSVSRAQKAGLVFPVSRIGKSLKKDGRTKRVAAGASVCLGATLEYLCAEMVEIAAQRCQKDKRKRITPADIVATLRADSELHKLTGGLTLSAGETMRKISQQLKPAATAAAAAAGQTEEE
ncbi:MAG: hypothetical protein CMI16_12685 [Opitutaceae bacterium]|nr:hypothetical protein [Opitutaceae bacterium]